MKPLKILYVEDNDDVRQGIGELLESPARVVVACASGEQALAANEAEACDVLLTDVSLPGLSGIELARRLLKTNPQQWVVLCSGYDLRQGLASLGPNARALPKPFGLEELDALMDEIAAHIATGAAKAPS